MYKYNIRRVKGKLGLCNMTLILQSQKKKKKKKSMNFRKIFSDYDLPL